MKVLLCALVIAMISPELHAQTKLFQVDVRRRLDNFQAISVGDSILLSYDEDLNEKWTRKTSWITRGLERQYLLAVDPLAVARKQDGDYLYYLDVSSNKVVTLKCLVIDRNSKKQSLSELNVPIRGRILGSFVDGSLFIVVLDRIGLGLSILEINRGEKLKEQRFTLPLDILRYVENYEAEVFMPNSPVDSFKGFSNVKAFYRNGQILLTIDYIAPDISKAPNVSQLPEKRIGTTVVKIDPEQNQLTSFILPTTKKGVFGSFIVDNLLFQILPREKIFQTFVYDLDTKKLLGTDSIQRSLDDFRCYFRYGRKNVIGRNATLHQLMDEAVLSTPAIYVEKSNGKYVIQWGTYFNEKGAITPRPSVVGMITSLVGTTILQLREYPGVHRYFYYEYDTLTGFKRRNLTTELLHEKIDHYELDYAVDVTFKTYINHAGGVAGIYYDAKKNKLSVIAFK